MSPDRIVGIDLVRVRLGRGSETVGIGDVIEV